VVTDTRGGVLSIPILALTVRERGDLEALPNEDEAARSAGEAAEGRDADVEGVFVVREGKAQFVAVETGITGREHFEVLTGLTEKDSVVAGPYEAIRSLENGANVRRMQAIVPAPGAAAAQTNRD
jgi:HlyD family secretion protein